MPFDNAYEAITEQNDHAHWAFGTGFDDPLAGVDTAVPAGVDANALAAQCLALGDDALVMSQRLIQWITNAPEIEEEVALANVALDLLGQARLLFTRSSQAAPAPSRSGGRWPAEDELAYLREPGGFRNVRLVEQPRGDFAQEIARLLVFSTWRLALMTQLAGARDPVLAAIAGKAVKELTYHRDFAAGWAIRLGDGTEHSRARMNNGLHAVWPYVPELFGGDTSLRAEFDAVARWVCGEATLDVPAVAADSGGGRDGLHTPALTDLLADLQGFARENLDATW